MKRLTIPGSGTESRATKPARVSAPATLGGAAFKRFARGHRSDLLEAAQAAEIEQQATLEAAPVEQSYPRNPGALRAGQARPGGAHRGQARKT